MEIYHPQDFEPQGPVLVKAKLGSTRMVLIF